MNLTRTRTPDNGPDAARRRLDLLGQQLSVDRPPISDDLFDDPTGLPSPGLGSARHRAPTLTRRETWSGDLHDRLPPRWQSFLGRGVSAQHVVVLVAIVGAIVCVTAWWLISSKPSVVTPVSAPVVPTTGGSAGQAASAKSPASAGSASPGAASGSSTGAAQVVVDVTGKVRKPGIVTLPGGSRVTDALKAAGGPRAGADLSTVNLARVLVDGEQIVVGLPAVSTGASPSGSSGASAVPVNLNSATMEQLDTLPGVGPVTAQSILDWRSEHGRFTSVDELLEVKGIGDVTLADLRDLVTV